MIALNDDTIVEEGRGGDWAVRLWPVVERAFAAVGGSDERAALLARKAEIENELAEIEEKLRALERS